MTELIVIPMAGESRRFLDAGYTTPKYRLEVGGLSLLRHAVGSFSAYFDTSPFLFVLRGSLDEQRFVEGECRSSGIRDFEIVVLERPTQGQAESVSLGIDGQGIDDEAPLTIFNIDTIRPGFRFPLGEPYDHADGSLEVFRGDGAHWSFVRPAVEGQCKVAETAEKKRISDLCSTGLYRFARARHFREAFELARIAAKGAEIYVAPLYNYLIAAGLDVRYWTINSSDVIFSGIPVEYEAFKRSYA